MIKTLLAIFVGGGIGSLLRYAVAVAFQGQSFPWGTFIANAISCILLGLFVGLFDMSTQWDHRVKLFLITGICGGFSTFSTFSYQSFKLWSDGQHLAFFANIGGSVLVCLICIFLGIKIISLII